ncbi:secretin N-terminal domain-containing protein [Singulisphaera acidiphila]|uniref:Type II secretory pathway, component PulD n=1 Tax=Singulisphaera acidiphila (strain ATCC BAA-1392 / DSM 18658 / VKM B-2454 / MOB10) TaxID=886293 RepID=L0DMH3_SINAD|nr:secretin N-terminal domain-containing protein [Singulisphaera acidiphila]AGA30584.1 type II secretory pathway, component PulD [Singulisphaera acidiphila DSM 18658]
MRHAKWRVPRQVWFLCFEIALVTVLAFAFIRSTFVPRGVDETTRPAQPRDRLEAASKPPLRQGGETVQIESPTSRRAADDALVRTGLSTESSPVPLSPEPLVESDSPKGPSAKIFGARPPDPVPPTPTPAPVQVPAIAIESGPEREQAPPGLEPLKPPNPMPDLSLPDAIERKPRADDRLTLRAEDQEVRQVLALLSRQSGVNILLSPAVQGQIRIDLQDVTFKQALDAIVRLANLGVKEDQGLIYVYSAQEMSEMKAKEREPVVRVYHLNYIRANDLRTMIRPFLSSGASVTTTPPAMQGLKGAGGGSRVSGGGGAAGGGAGAGVGAGGAGGGGGDSPNTAGASLGMGGSGALTAGGGVAGTSDTGGNSLSSHDIVIVRDYPENLATIDEVVRRVDVQPPQVLIEAVILSVQLNNTQSLGINFSVVDNIQHKALVGGSGALVNAAGGFTPARVLAAAPLPAPFTRVQPGELIPGYTGSNTGLKFGFISNNVSGFIEAIESLNKTNILASPRVLVLNKQRAEIQLGQRLGFKNTVTNLTSSLQTVEFLSVGTLLTLRPFVSNDGMVRMEVHPEKSTGTLDSQGIPQTNTSEVTTNIMVPDGATIVIGGLIDDQDEIVEEGIPGLNRIPVLGAAFRTRRTRSVKNELIVLLTPRIIRRGGLPDPELGLPPRGEMGIPNSGPMPGPAVQPGEVLVLPPGFEPAGSTADTYQLPPSPAPAASPLGGGPPPIRSSPNLTLPDTPPLPPVPMPPSEDDESPLMEDESLQEGTSGYNGPSRFFDSAPTPSEAIPRRFFDTASAARTTTRSQATSDPATVTTSMTAPNPAVLTSAVTPATARGFPHRVRPGEDFASISQYYYGTPKHAAALLNANRQQVVDTGVLRPGTEIIVPPAQLLSAAENPVRDQEPLSPATAKPTIVPERERSLPGRRSGAESPKPSAVEPPPAVSDPGSRSRAGSHSAGFLSRFQVQELASWPVPPGVSREEALKGHKGDTLRGMLQRSAPKRADAPPTEAGGPGTTSRPPSTPPAVTVRPSLGLRLFGAGRKASQAMPDAGGAKP